MNKIKIKEILPHGEGFLFVDEVLQINQDQKKIIALKRTSEKDFWYEHHFPKNPIVPGVIIIEAMAQTCGILAATLYPESKGKPMYLAGIREARFKKPIIPPAEIILECILESKKAKIWFFDCKAFANNEQVATSKIVAAEGTPK